MRLLSACAACYANKFAFLYIPLFDCRDSVFDGIAVFF